MEPRKHNRYPLVLPVIFSWDDAKEVRRQDAGVTRDISVKGAFVLTSSPPPLQANVELEALLAPVRSTVYSLRICGQGQVVRVEPVHDGERRGGFAVAGKHFTLRKR